MTMNNQFNDSTWSLTQSVTRRVTLKKFGPGLTGMALVVIGASLFVVCPAQADGFRSTGAMNSPRDGHTATLLLNGKVLVAGGGVMTTNELSSAELYDPATGSWSMTTPMHAIRWGHTATLLTNGLVLVAGGSEGVGAPYAEVYNPDTGIWTATIPMTRYRFFHTATLLQNGQVLLAGGDNTASAELYDPVTQSWSPTGPMTEIRYDHTATLLPDGRVLVAGGNDYTGDFYDVSYTAELYDPVSRTWTATGEMNDPRTQHTSTLLPNGLVLVAGGWAVSIFYGQVSLPSAELYDPSTETWDFTGHMVSSIPTLGFIGRFAHTATLLPDGSVLITGGEFHYDHAPGGALYFAEQYDPASGTWTATERMASNREYHSATLLESGEVLVAGGFLYFGNADLFSAERYGAVPTTTTLTAPVKMTNGSFHFAFTNVPGAVFSVMAETNLVSPSSQWSVLGGVTEVSPGQFQFTDTQATNHPQRFYRVLSP